MKKNYKKLKRISNATLLEESTHIHSIVKSLIIIAFFIVLLLIWSIFTKVQETASSFGELVPSGEVQQVQYLDGGIVVNVIVKNGMLVKKGDALVIMDVTSAVEEINQYRSKAISLLLDSARLNMFVKNESPDNFKIDNAALLKYNTNENKGKVATLINDQKRLLVSQINNLKEQQDPIKDTIKERLEKVKELKNKYLYWEEHMKLLKQEFSMYQSLKQNNYISHKDYLTLLRAVNEAQGNGTQIKGEIAQTESSVDEAKNKLDVLFSEAKENALKELTKANADLLETQHKILKLEAQIDRAKVKAPVSGTVKGIQVFKGNVVKPGATLMEIVPQGQALVAETRINPKDIGYLKVGNEVNVKVLTYDYARFGSIKGHLSELSASTFMDEHNQPYYKAKTELTKQYIGEGSRKKELKAGMTVEADVLTGEKSLFEYLLKPIYRAKESAFHER